MPADEQEAADGGPIVTEAARDAHRRVRHLLSSGATRSATIAWSAAPPSEPNTGRSARSVASDHVSPTDQEQRHECLEAPAARIRGPARPIRPVPSQAAHEARKHCPIRYVNASCDCGAPRQLTPDPHERVRRRGGDRADEADGEHGTQGGADITAHTRRGRREKILTLPGRAVTSQNDASTDGPMSRAKRACRCRPCRRVRSRSRGRALSAARDAPIRTPERNAPPAS